MMDRGRSLSRIAELQQYIKAPVWQRSAATTVEVVGMTGTVEIEAIALHSRQSVLAGFNLTNGDRSEKMAAVGG